MFRCEGCGNDVTRVTQSAVDDQGRQIRRRFCPNCRHRFTTVEVLRSHRHYIVTQDELDDLTSQIRNLLHLLEAKNNNMGKRLGTGPGFIRKKGLRETPRNG